MIDHCVYFQEMTQCFYVQQTYFAPPFVQSYSINTGTLGTHGKTYTHRDG